MLSPSPRKALLWCGIIVVLCVLFYSLRNVLVPFVAAAIIAYLLNPAANFLERHKHPRWLATTTVMVVFSAAFIGILLLFVPVLQVQAEKLMAALPGIIETLQARALPILEHAQTILPPETLAELQQSAQGQASKAVGLVGKLAGNVVSSGLSALNIIMLMVLTPVLTFYLLRDWNTMVAAVYSLFPRYYYDTICEQLAKIDATLSGFIRGQMLVCLSLGSFYAIALTLAGLDFGFVIGLLSGVISFIPYVGTIIGGLTSLGMAFSQFGLEGATSIIIVAAIFGVGQFVEGNILSPKLVGERVNLHPLWIIFALFAGGGLFGFVGVLLAVPVAAVLGVLIRFGLEEYKQSTLYETPIETVDETMP